MKNILLFKEWLGVSPEIKFGFSPKTPEFNRKPFYLEQPIEEFNLERMLNELKDMGKVGTKMPNDSWGTSVKYGEGVGAIQVDSSPYGSFKCIVRRKVTDLEGNLTDCCRLVVPLINDFNHRGPNDPSESIVADKLFDKLNEIDREPLQAPKGNWTENFFKLIQKFNENVKNKHPLIMEYEGYIKQDDNNYLFAFTYRGYGNGLPNSQKAEKFLINMQYQPKTGLIHSWGYEVASPQRVREFYVTPSEWDEYFCPTQPANEIIGCLSEIFMTY
jgi:hypothetical protein